MKKTVLKKYAKLLVRVGVNIKKGQDAVINADLDQPEFVKLVVEEFYRAGARSVTVEWNYAPLAKIHTRYKTISTMAKVENWELEKLKHRIETLPARLHIVSSDPDGKKGINQEKLAKVGKLRHPIIKPYSDQMDSKYQWCIAAVPGVAWAKKVFPNETKARAVEKLWEAILSSSRVTDDPIEAWNRHNEILKSRYDYLNSLGIESLEYKSSNGTDLKVGLIEDSSFAAGGEYTIGGNFFNPNIPSEEVFISPKKGEAEGIVYSTKPLSYNGELIENFSIRFEGGKAVEVHAEKNADLLKQMITMDEGAAYLGECALVAFDSPINNSGILFYNTLFDENASCHLALGRGFTHCIKDFSKYTLDECREKGINESMIHVDFMMGSADMSIVANCRDGKRVQLFKDGNWAF